MSKKMITEMLEISNRIFQAMALCSKNGKENLSCATCPYRTSLLPSTQHDRKLFCRERLQSNAVTLATSVSVYFNKNL